MVVASCSTQGGSLHVLYLHSQQACGQQMGNKRNLMHEISCWGTRIWSKIYLDHSKGSFSELVSFIWQELAQSVDARVVVIVDMQASLGPTTLCRFSLGAWSPTQGADAWRYFKHTVPVATATCLLSVSTGKELPCKLYSGCRDVEATALS